MQPNLNINVLAQFNCRAGANDIGIQHVETQAGLNLPNDYKQFLRFADGGDGPIGRLSYLSLWSTDKLMPLNAAYHVSEFAPGLFLFGSDGGDEAYGFDMRFDDKPVVAIPFVGMDLRLARPVAHTFSDFLQSFAND